MKNKKLSMKQTLMKLSNYYTYPLMDDLMVSHAKKLGLSKAQLKRKIDLEYFSSIKEYEKEVKAIRQQMEE